MRYVFILAAIALLIFAVFFFKITAPVKDEAGTRMFPDLSKFDLASVDVANDNGAVHLKKSRGAWFLNVDGKETAVSTKSADAFLNDVVGVKYNYSFSPEEPLESYGLAEPAVRIVLITEDGKEIHLNAGKEAPTGRESYVQLGTENRIFMVPFDRAAQWKRVIADDFKSKNVLRVEPKDVSRINLSVMDVKYALLPDGTNRERLAEVMDALNTLSLMNIVPVEKDDLRFYSFSLDYPLVEISIEKKDGTTDSLKFSKYQGYYIYKVDEKNSTIHVFDPASVEGFLDAVKKLSQN